jgi:hypothetical protein
MVSIVIGLPLLGGVHPVSQLAPLIPPVIAESLKFEIVFLCSFNDFKFFLFMI